jgi:3-dehydroquinate synthase
MQKLEQRFSIQYAFPVYFVRNIFNGEEQLLASLLLQAGEKRHKVLCIVDSGVMEMDPALAGRIEDYAAANRDVMQLCGPIVTISGGEICKSQPAVIESIVRHIHTHHLCRQSFILAIGGGAVLDGVGYAAAIAHRGVRLIRMPTTVLAQNDAGVGVKNGINALGRKNFLGTFATPFAVINDFSFLDTLPPRQQRAGIAEAVKVALIKDNSFFSYLEDQRHKLAAFERRPMEKMIHQCAALHMHHIGTQGDPFEFGSSRPLDFGHWSAHKLEEMTGSMLNHGEAVSVGMALDSLYSRHIGMIEEDDAQRIFTLLTDLGLPLYHPALAVMDVSTALHEFQEHLGGELTITLLTGIGSKKEVNRIDTDLMKRCIEELALRFSGRNEVADHTSDRFAPHFGVLN